MSNLVIYKPTTAIEERRKMLDVPEVFNSMNNIEKEIFESSTKRQIKEIDKMEFFALFRLVLVNIVNDIGYNVPANKDLWCQIQNRIAEMLYKYFSEYTLTDISLAFEMLAVGELDEYLPKDGNGMPDKKHYQQLNIDYFSKILNAYKIKKNKVVSKAVLSLPAPTNEISEEEKNYWLRQTKKRNWEAFHAYKRGKSYILKNTIEEDLCYDWLVRAKVIEDIDLTTATTDDKKMAMSIMIGKIAKGLVNRYDGRHIIREGEDGDKIKYEVCEVMKRKAIKEAFEKIINENLDIKTLINL